MNRRERIDLGQALLDAKVPGWRERIDPKKLDMADYEGPTEKEEVGQAGIKALKKFLDKQPYLVEVADVIKMHTAALGTRAVLDAILPLIRPTEDVGGTRSAEEGETGNETPLTAGRQLTRELCAMCNTFSGGFFSPIWKQVAGRYKHDILCLGCFAMLGDEKDIAWEEGLEANFVSLRTQREAVKVTE